MFQSDREVYVWHTKSQQPKFDKAKVDVNGFFAEVFYKNATEVEMEKKKKNATSLVKAVIKTAAKHRAFIKKLFVVLEGYRIAFMNWHGNRKKV